MTEISHIPVDSLDKLQDAVKTLETLLRDRVNKTLPGSYEAEPEIWYRGHSHGRFELLPSLLREQRSGSGEREPPLVRPCGVRP